MKQLYTRWGKEFNKENVLAEYPRPLLEREEFICLNGEWDYAITKDFCRPYNYDGKIVVPFSPESQLSGVNRQLQPDEYLWYRKEFDVDDERLSKDSRLILHFGAVDQSCIVYVNHKPIIEHINGYLPFSVDITDYLQKSHNGHYFLSDQELVVAVRDASDTSFHAKGKQKLQRGGMYYTAQSGIWQTVWMEYVPEVYVEELDTEPDLDNGLVRITVKSKETMPVRIQVREPKIYVDLNERPEDSPVIAEAEGYSNHTIEIKLPEIQPWNCETPYLYYFNVELEQFFDAENDTPDVVQSYFALRTFTIEKDENQYPRICLNHKEQFQRGVLDQGYWPEGLYTAPSDEAFIFDIQAMKDLGFNMMRKHIKIEPQRWYYHCDRLGMVVWQDMVNGGSEYKSWYVTNLATVLSWMHIKRSDKNEKLLARLDRQGQQEFIAEMKETIKVLKGHPSIAVWVIFNEGWGQFRTNEMTDIVRGLDSTRLIDQASGWFDQGGGDMNSIHNYFFKLKARKDSKRAFVLSEYGGYSLQLQEHCTTDKLYGYGTYKDKESLNEAFRNRENEVRALIPQGLCASVYTQVSDIEDEVNGIFTYDREIQKIEKFEWIEAEPEAEADVNTAAESEIFADAEVNTEAEGEIAEVAEVQAEPESQTKVEFLDDLDDEDFMDGESAIEIGSEVKFAPKVGASGNIENK